MANIILHQFQGISVGLDRKDGYLNATKLCAAYSLQYGTSKLPAEWARTKRAKSYIAYVSSVRGIHITDLVVVRQGGMDEQGTWIHPDLGDAFASWLSVEYEFAVSQWLQEWRTGELVRKFPENVTGLIAKTPKQESIELIGCAIDTAFSAFGIAPEVMAGIKLTAIAANHPEIRPAIEAAKRSAMLPVESKLLCPTELAAIWEEQTGEKLSAIAFNKKLEAANLQKKTGNKTLPWQAIGCGIDHSEVVLDTATGHGKTVQRLMWHKSVIDLLQ